MMQRPQFRAHPSSSGGCPAHSCTQPKHQLASQVQSEILLCKRMPKKITRVVKHSKQRQRDHSNRVSVRLYQKSIILNYFEAIHILSSFIYPSEKNHP